VNILLKHKALALIEAISFCGGVRHKKFSGEQEIAPKKLLFLNYILKHKKT
jgi:hypothetical protein